MLCSAIQFVKRYAATLESVAVEALIGLIVVEPKSPAQGVANKIVSIAFVERLRRGTHWRRLAGESGSLRNDAG
jgi:hypothetical protein